MGVVILSFKQKITNSESNNSAICFYDLNERNIKSRINIISKNNNNRERLIMITKELLLIPGPSKISIINVYQYRIVRIIDVLGSNSIYGACMLNKNMLVTGDGSKVIRQWRIEGDNLILISKKNNSHDNDIITILNIGDGHIASGSSDNTIKIW